MHNLQDLMTAGFKPHHTALTAGYVRKASSGIVLPYDGRFGKGFKLLTHNPNSTRYCWVTYLIQPEEARAA